MKMRGKTTVDLSGRTGRCEGTAPSKFTAGISPTERSCPKIGGGNVAGSFPRYDPAPGALGDDPGEARVRTCSWRCPSSVLPPRPVDRRRPRSKARLVGKVTARLRRSEYERPIASEIPGQVAWRFRPQRNRP